ncbi:MAG: hypothetical protein FWG77_01570 [Treponema sp.]|nr:hypothetical protein [Treponema sp.]
MSSSFALFFSITAFFITLFSFFYFKSYLGKRTAKEHVLAEINDEVNKILRSINEVTERDISLIKDRERDLKNLLTETEKLTSAYIKEMEKVKDANTAYEQVIAAPSYQDLGKNFRLKVEQDLFSEPPEPVAPVPQASPSALPLTEPSALPSALPSDEEQVPDEKLSRNEQIISMVQAGFPAPLIASRLEISIAEVEFATALLERKTGSI